MIESGAFEQRIDETKLNTIDRLGLAYCRLNSYEWDDICGKKPKDFDGLPDTGYETRRGVWRLTTKRSKCDYILPLIALINHIIGEENTSRCWWKFVRGKTETEWFQWWMENSIKEKKTL